MDNNKKLNALKMVYIGQQRMDSSGAGGGARVKNIVNIFKKIGVKIDLISYSTFSNKFGIEHKEI